MKALHAISIPIGLCWWAGGLGYAEIDTRELVRRAVVAEENNWAIARSYGHDERVDFHYLDNNNKPKNKEVKTFDVTLPGGSPYRRLLQRDDQPLPPAGQKKEWAALGKSTEARLKESAVKRNERVADYCRRPEWLREFWHNLPEAFDFKLLREENVRGRAMTLLEATPHAERLLDSWVAKAMARIKGRIWIDKATGYLAKAEISVVDSIWMGLFLVRVGVGSHGSYEQVRVADRVWMPLRTQASVWARLGLVKALNFEQETLFGDYRELPETAPMISRAMAP